MLLENLKAFLESDEGKEYIKKFHEERENNEKILNFKIDRFKRFIDSGKIIFSTFVEHVIKKYDSDKYVNFWYKKGIEPPEDLSFLLFDFASKYGTEATDKEYEKYGNVFTSSMFKYENYFFNLMNGQGTVVKIIKEE